MRHRGNVRLCDSTAHCFERWPCPVHGTLTARTAAMPFVDAAQKLEGIKCKTCGYVTCSHPEPKPEEIRDLLDDRDHWKKRAEQAEYALDLPKCRHCGCLFTAHAVDDEERRQCLDCSCKQFEVLDG